MLKRILILTTTGLLFLAPVAGSVGVQVAKAAPSAVAAGEDDGGSDDEATPPPTTTTPVPVAPAPPAPVPPAPAPPAPAPPPAPKPAPHKAKSAPVITHTSVKAATPVPQTTTFPVGGIQAGAGGSARTSDNSVLAGLSSGAAVLLLSAGGIALRRRMSRG
jgi:hypothetical protein